MKHPLILSACLLAVPAMAHGVPPQTPPASPEFGVDTRAGAVAGAAAGAVSGSNASAITGDSAATGVGIGGGGGQATSGGSYSATQGGDTSNRMYVLPSPVWASVPQAAGCITTSARSAAIGWNFISAAKSDQRSDPACVGVIMAKAAYDHCHFESEQMIMQRVYETVFPGAPALPAAPGVRNLSLAECEAIKRPHLVMTPTLSPVAYTSAAPATARAPKDDRQ